MEDNRDTNFSETYNEDWLDFTFLFSTEFKLPIVSSPFSSSWLDHNDSFTPENQLHTSPIRVPEFDPIEVPPVSTTSLAMSAPSHTSNVSLPMINQQGTFPMENHQVHDPNSTSNPWLSFNGFNGSANSSWFDSNGSLPMSDQQRPNIPGSSNMFQFGTSGSIPLRDQQTFVSNASSNGFFSSINQSTHIPTSRFGFKGSLLMSNQQAHVPSFGPTPLFGSNNASPSMNNQVMNIQQGFSPNIMTGTSLLKSKCSLSKQSHTVFVPPSASNASWPDAYPSVPNQPSPHSSLPLHPGWTYFDDDLHMCNVCQKIFPTPHALGGHMSSHAKARKKEAMMAGQPFKSDYSITRSHSPFNTNVSNGFGDGSGPTTYLSTAPHYLLEVVTKKMEKVKSPKNKKQKQDSLV